MSLRSIAAALAVTAAAAALGAAKSKTAPPGPVMTPSEILGKMHAINQMEMQAGRLAQARSGNAEVRRYGALLERDHRFADRRVLALARSEGVELPAPAPSPADERLMASLQRAKGAAFDRQFLPAMKTGHDQALGMLAAAQMQTKNTRVADIIRKLSPILRQHDELAQRLQG